MYILIVKIKTNYTRNIIQNLKIKLIMTIILNILGISSLTKAIIIINYKF